MSGTQWYKIWDMRCRARPRAKDAWTHTLHRGTEVPQALSFVFHSMHKVVHGLSTNFETSVRCCAMRTPVRMPVHTKLLTQNPGSIFLLEFDMYPDFPQDCCMTVESS